MHAAEAFAGVLHTYRLTGKINKGMDVGGRLGAVNPGDRTVRRSRSPDIHVRACWHMAVESSGLFSFGPHIPKSACPHAHRTGWCPEVIPAIPSCPRRAGGSPIIPAILSAMTGPRINLHLVSDATGETLNAIARATTVQFEQADINLPSLEPDPDAVPAAPGAGRDRARARTGAVYPCRSGAAWRAWRRHAAGWMCRWSMCSTR